MKAFKDYFKEDYVYNTIKNMINFYLPNKDGLKDYISRIKESYPKEFLTKILKEHPELMEYFV